jgi:hypothetical protein
MQKDDRVIVADLSLSFPLRQLPYLGRAHRLGHHDGVAPHIRGIGHSARLRQVELPFPEDRRPHPIVIDMCSICDATTAFAPTVSGWAERDHLHPVQHLGRIGVGGTAPDRSSLARSTNSRITTGTSSGRPGCAGPGNTPSGVFGCGQGAMHDG